MRNVNMNRLFLKIGCIGSTYMIPIFLLFLISFKADIAYGETFARVDIQKILLNCNAGSKAKNILKQIADKYEKTKIEKENLLRSLKNKFENDSSLNSEEQNNLKNFIQANLKQYNSFLEYAKNDLKTINDIFTNYIVEGIVQVIQQYGNENGLSAIYSVGKDDKINTVYAKDHSHMQTPDNGDLLKYNDISIFIENSFNSNKQYIVDTMKPESTYIVDITP